MKSIKKIGIRFWIRTIKMNKCLKNEKIQDQILNERIEAQKKYKIESTPTIYINEKKYEDKHEYKPFKKAIKKFYKNMKFKKLEINGFKSFLIKQLF